VLLDIFKLKFFFDQKHVLGLNDFMQKFRDET